MSKFEFKGRRGIAKYNQKYQKSQKEMEVNK
jgi:hypothetical protein